MKKNLTFILFVALVLIQLGVIGILGTNLYRDIRIARVHSINDIRGTTVQKVQGSRYENFYELNVEHFERNKDGSKVSNPVTPSHTVQGFRERHLYATTTDDTVVRIVALGDSNTYGLGVRIEDVFTELLEDRLNAEPLCAGKKYEVINLGVPGYDMLFAEERFRLHGLSFKPDAVLWYLYQNDFTEYKDEQLRLTYQIIESGRRNEIKGDVGEYTVQKVRQLYSKGFLEDLQLSAVKDMSMYFDGNILLFSGNRYVTFMQKMKLNTAAA